MKLLPHYVNIAAICWLVLWAVVRCTLPFILHGAPDWPTWVVIGNITALGLACFSAEKIEDEMINSLRLNSIAIIAGLYLCVFTLGFFLSIVGVSGRFYDILNNIFIPQVDIWYLFYILLLKIRIFAVSRRMSND